MKVAKEYKIRKIADEYIIVPTGEMIGKFHGAIQINDIGAKIWNYLLENKSFSEICNSLIEDFPNIPPERVREDVRLFLDSLIKLNLVYEDERGEEEG